MGRVFHKDVAQAVLACTFFHEEKYILLNRYYDLFPQRKTFEQVKKVLELTLTADWHQSYYSLFT